VLYGLWYETGPQTLHLLRLPADPTPAGYCGACIRVGVLSVSGCSLWAAVVFTLPTPYTFLRTVPYVTHTCMYTPVIALAASLLWVTACRVHQRPPPCLCCTHACSPQSQLPTRLCAVCCVSEPACSLTWRDPTWSGICAPNTQEARRVVRSSLVCCDRTAVSKARVACSHLSVQPLRAGSLQVSGRCLAACWLSSDQQQCIFFAQD
jgi:hypothetical protein